MPPGIKHSADRVLQARLFSYPDTYRHRIGVNYQQLPVNAPRNGVNVVNVGSFQCDVSMAFFNQGARPNYLSYVAPIQFKMRTVDLDNAHGHFTGEAITFLSKIRPEDFNALRALWQKAWDEPASESFIQNVTGKMELCGHREPLKRQIAIFREVDPEIAQRLEKSTGITGYDGIASMRFGVTHNGFAKDEKIKYANGINIYREKSVPANNGGLVHFTHKSAHDDDGK